MGRDASRGLRHTTPVGKNLGFIPQPLFDRMLGAELSLLHREQGGLELLLVDIEGAALSSDLALELQKRGGIRLGVCRRDGGTLALYKRASTAATATSAISAALATLIATGTVRATGWASIVDDGLPAVSPDVALQLAGLALGQSRSTPTGRAERLVLGRGPTLDRTATASHTVGRVQ
jgi:hypothetical protein